MGRGRAGAALLAVAALLAGGCSGSWFAAAPPRVVVVSPQPPGPLDVRALAVRLEAETGAQVEVREVPALSHEAVRAAARSIVAARPALVVAPSTDIVYALRDNTQAIPILFVSMSDPIQANLVTDERRPHGNISGFTFHVPIEHKQLELLERAFPGVRSVGVVGDRGLFTSNSFHVLAEAARGPLAVEIVRVHFESEADLRAALAQPAAAAVDAWVVPSGSAAFRLAPQVVALLAATGKPAVFGSERFVRLGGLMSYSPSFEDAPDRIVDMAKSVLQGFPVGDLPVERPQNFRFAVNTTAWQRFAPPRKVLLLATDFYAGEAAP